MYKFFLILTLVISLHRYYTFYSSYDQGIFNQMFWNSLNGFPAETSLASGISSLVVHSQQLPVVAHSHLGTHFTPALLIWLPFYALFPSPATLSVLQVIWVTAGGLVLYFLARQYLQPFISLLITVSYYCAIAVVAPTLSNFHNLSQIPLAFFSLLLAMEKRWWWLFWVLALWILAIRQDVGLVLFSLGIYLFFSKRHPRLGILLCGISVLYIITVVNLVMPHFSDDVSQRLLIQKFGQYVDKPTASTIEVLWGMISQPGLLIKELVSPVGQTISYLLGHWLPLAFIPAIAPASWMVAGFPLLYLLLAKGMSVLAISLRYAMTVVPGLFYGAILWWSGQGWHNFFQKPEKIQPRKLTPKFQRFWIFCIGLSLVLAINETKVSQALYFMIPDSIQPWVHVSLPQQWQRSGEINSLLTEIPSDASVSATTYLIPHLSGRREIIRLPHLKLRTPDGQVSKVDYVIADLWRLQHYQVAFEHERNLLQSFTNLIEGIIANQEYGITNFQNGVILLKKGVTSDVAAQKAWLTFRQQIGGIEK
ncbi:MAG: DUF2079 domain-containing protein [Xenococcus sp. MO_188.B8]|nr:DUF2079 domain-containing protein [Xenococcus sp. MO_188.B8]